jgi:hypothetical protein
VQVDKDTVCDWLDRAAQHWQILLYLWRDLPVAECQLDELWSFVHAKGGSPGHGQAGVRILGRGVDLDSLCAGLKMVLAFVVGKRTQANANLLLHGSCLDDSGTVVVSGSGFLSG